MAAIATERFSTGLIFLEEKSFSMLVITFYEDSNSTIILIVRPVTKHVSNTVHEESNIKGGSEANCEAHPECYPHIFGPVEVRNEHRNANDQQGKQWNVVSEIKENKN